MEFCKCGIEEACKTDEEIEWDKFYYNLDIKEQILIQKQINKHLQQQLESCCSNFINNKMLEPPKMPPKNND